MKIADRRNLCVAVTVCVLRLGDTETITRSFAGLDAGQAAPTSAGRQAPAQPQRPEPERFMVRYQGCALLGPDGEEKDRLESITNGAGAISQDGLWAAFSRSEPNPLPGKLQGTLVLQSRLHPEERTSVPLIWGDTGSSFLPLWSSDSKRILICEQGHNEDGTRGSAYRVYDLGSKRIAKLQLPDEWWPSDWSADGKSVLTNLRAENGNMRVARVHTDGTGAPEFLTSDQETAYGARLSPDNRQILCMVGPRTPKDEKSRTRLYVVDLATNKRTVIDKPGHTHGYCWSSDGLKVAYTWQLPLRQPDDVVERKTYLITSDADGTNQKTVTMRKCEVPRNSSGRNNVVIFFEVLAWWR
jgi:dipeptidyl aminopeptidase/acylaminoacyl peptidase